MQRLEVSGAVRPIYGSLGVKRLTEKLRPCKRVFIQLIHLINRRRYTLFSFELNRPLCRTKPQVRFTVCTLCGLQ